jgi:hypothetical protein
MNDELEWIWKESLVSQFNVLSRYLTGGTEENHENPQPCYPVSALRLEVETSEYQTGNVNY